ncbi:hypothetical protein [Sinorhizobium meliloti]|uniref:hypothetical protein n=1 Tax=Rhizobium meliloti TaxID=382 RepID=UPI002D77AF22|nr:hypothetical protein [Sinorhizobium meliloti]
MTPPETLVLTNALECSEIEASLVPFTDFGPMHPIRVRRHELLEAFRASAPHVDSALSTSSWLRSTAMTAFSERSNLISKPWPRKVRWN